MEINIKKELQVQMFKQLIRISYPPVLAEMYCRQIDFVNYYAKCLDTIRKYMIN